MCCCGTCDTVDEQKVQPILACCCCHQGFFCPCQFPGCLGAEGTCGLCCLQCEVCIKPKPPLQCLFCGPTCNGGCQGLKIQGQFFCQVINLKFPCDSEVPCIINIFGYTCYPSESRGCLKTIGEINAGNKKETENKDGTTAPGEVQVEVVAPGAAAPKYKTMDRDADLIRG